MGNYVDILVTKLTNSVPSGEHFVIEGIVPNRAGYAIKVQLGISATGGANVVFTEFPVIINADMSGNFTAEGIMPSGVSSVTVAMSVAYADVLGSFIVDDNIQVVITAGVTKVYLLMGVQQLEKGSVSPGSGQYSPGYVSIMATPDTNWEFSYWLITEDGVNRTSSSPSDSVHLIAGSVDNQAVAHFVLVTTPPPPPPPTDGWTSLDVANVSGGSGIDWNAFTVIQHADFPETDTYSGDAQECDFYFVAPSVISSIAWAKDRIISAFTDKLSASGSVPLSIDIYQGSGTLLSNYIVKAIAYKKQSVGYYNAAMFDPVTWTTIILAALVVLGIIAATFFVIKVTDLVWGPEGKENPIATSIWPIAIGAGAILGIIMIAGSRKNSPQYSAVGR